MSVPISPSIIGDLLDLVLPCLPQGEEVSNVVENALRSMAYREGVPFDIGYFSNGWTARVQSVGRTRSTQTTEWDPRYVRFYQVVGRVLHGEGEIGCYMPTDPAGLEELRDAMQAFFLELMREQ